VQTIGVIVAGGKSRRMGRDKAAIIFEGQTLLDRAATLLRASAPDQIIILGRPAHKYGIEDPLPDAGPAANLTTWINKQPLPLRLTVLPVDMPLLTSEQLQALEACPKGAFFEDLYLPLTATIREPISDQVVRMKDLLRALDLQAIPVQKTWQKALTNFNSANDIDTLLGG